MTFLQPIIFWALPLLLLPVIIHLINRLRHKPQVWAAMRFLQAATRSAVSHAKLRQFLILAMRVLAVLLLILFLARPLSGNWLGWMWHPAPDAIVLMLDRSASMQELSADGTTSLREEALQIFLRNAKTFDGRARFVLLDSASQRAEELASINSLSSLSSVRATDTAADWPAMFASLLKWSLDAKPGSLEVWVATDLQKSNWRPTDSVWRTVEAQFAGAGLQVRFRLLELSHSGKGEQSVRLDEVAGPSNRSRDKMKYSALLQGNSDGTKAATTSSLTVTVNGSSTDQTTTLREGTTRTHANADIGANTNGGWIKLSLPPDGSPQDNTSYGVYGPIQAARSLVVAEDKKTGRIVELALKTAGSVQRIEPTATLPVLQSFQTIVWQGAIPNSGLADALRQHVTGGGTLLLLPSAKPSAATPSTASGELLAGLAWISIDTITNAASLRVERWNEEEGPFVRTEEGYSLPLKQTEFSRRWIVSGATNTLAAFADGAPLLTRQTLGEGKIYLMTTLPLPGWSTLGEGPVLVPMLTRLAEIALSRNPNARMSECGRLSTRELEGNWQVVAGPERAAPRLNAGVYRDGDRWLAINRPAAEDEPERVTSDEMQAALKGFSWNFWQEKQKNDSPFRGEIWRFFLLFMLLALLFEGWLILPRKDAPVSGLNNLSTRPGGAQL